MCENLISYNITFTGCIKIIYKYGSYFSFDFSRIELYMEVIISSLINIKIEVLSLGTNLKSCKSECSELDGHLPYVFEARVILLP